MYKTIWIVIVFICFGCSDLDDNVRAFKDVGMDRSQDFKNDAFGDIDFGRDLAGGDASEDLSEDMAVLQRTALHDYVDLKDDVFKYDFIKSVEQAGFRQYILRVTSQRWRSEAEVDKPIWEHDVFLFIPDNFSTNTVILLIDGGSNKEMLPDDIPTEAAFLRLLATKTKSAFAVVRQNPNQPLKFLDRDNPLSEDKLIAYSWRKLMEESDPTWAAYFPMVKGVVRSMDAIQDFAEKNIEDVQLEDFIVTGFSKRGAATYLVAAVDDRVIGLAPGVFDILGLNQQMKHHYNSYGFWAPAVTPYINEELATFIDTPEMDFLATHVDPISYVEHLQEPKFLIMASGDQFFLPDASQSYFEKLKGEKAMRVYTNTGHSMSERITDVLNDLTQWIISVLNREPLSEISWEKVGDKLIVTSSLQPKSAKVWSVTNPNSRDFRHEVVGPNWRSQALIEKSDGVFEITLVKPETGFTGYIVDLTFENMTLSTPAFVAPDVYPFTFSP